MPDVPEPSAVSQKAVIKACATIADYFKPHAVAAFGDAALPQSEKDAVAIAREISRRQVDRFKAREMGRDWSISGMRSRR